MIQKKPVGLGFQKCNNVQKSKIRQMRPNSCKQLAGVSSVKTGRERNPTLQMAIS